MKWIVGSFSHETNTFSTVPTDLDAFQAQTYHVGAEIADRSAGTKTPIGGFIDVAQERGDELVFTVCAHATPSGLVSQEGLQSFLFKPFKAMQLIDEVKKAFAPPKKSKPQRKPRAGKTRSSRARS